MTVFLLFYFKVVSFWLKEAILSKYKIIELSGIMHELIITDMNNLTGNLVIKNYANLKFIQVNGNALQNILSLEICENPQLQSIKVCDFGCQFVFSLELSSIWLEFWMIWTSSTYYRFDTIILICWNKVINSIGYLIWLLSK